jgi:hypothetical protein
MKGIEMAPRPVMSSIDELQEDVWAKGGPEPELNHHSAYPTAPLMLSRVQLATEPFSLPCDTRRHVLKRLIIPYCVGFSQNYLGV